MTSPLDGRGIVLDTLDELGRELASNEDWENDTLPRYIEALGALLGSIENHYSNTGQALPEDPWVLMAHALRGARFYE
jgi:hypothetical protein